jgi:hypothetical protein
MSSKSEGFRIRGIWMADVANQGQSGVINEGLLGNDRRLILLILLSHPANRKSELVRSLQGPSSSYQCQAI